MYIRPYLNQGRTKSGSFQRFFMLVCENVPKKNPIHFCAYIFIVTNFWSHISHFENYVTSLGRIFLVRISGFKICDQLLNIKFAKFIHPINCLLCVGLFLARKLNQYFNYFSPASYKIFYFNTKKE
ncbi:hypothetical protein BpHYR1_013317 [Brachionus plicatilis]|uniref:Uncharacterized protein n=1 Tax=Brachionus plicatilis TaxID=10195 RepID=A0A3M7QSW8_BRAPC|nr:hypothetical protein BpHYR1_013317 [Brachionus plicatilis]